MKIFIIGINGKMGKAVISKAEDVGIVISGGIDISPNDKYPVFSNAESVNVDFDVIVDFSRPSSLGEIISLCKRTNKPAVICTTGYDEKQLKQIEDLSKSVAVFKSANMSLGINVMNNALKMLTKALAGYDIEIIEAHHNQKVDAPSGTALMLLDSVKSAQDSDSEVAYGRVGTCPRQRGEIGVHALRAGTIVGEHTVLFAANDEIIEIKHTALSRNVLALGAISASEFIINKKSGIYDMNDLIN